MKQRCVEREEERGRRWHVRGRPTKDAAAEGSRCAASEERTSLSVEDSAMRTDAGDPSSSKAKDPREWYPSFGTYDEEELPADVELPNGRFSDTVPRLPRRSKQVSDAASAYRKTKWNIYLECFHFHKRTP